MSLTTRQQEIKDEFIRVRGAWSDSWESRPPAGPGVPGQLPELLRRAVAEEPPGRQGQGVHLHRGRRQRHAHVPARRPAAHPGRAGPGGHAAGDHGGAGAGRHARHPRHEHRRADPGRGAGGEGPAHRPGPAHRLSGGGQGRVHQDARVLALVLGRDARAGPRAVRGLHRLLRAPVAARHARAEDQGARLHRVRHGGDAPVRQGPEAAHRERGGLRRDGAGDPRGHGDRQRAGHPRGDHGRADPGRGGAAASHAAASQAAAGQAAGPGRRPAPDKPAERIEPAPSGRLGSSRDSIDSTAAMASRSSRTTSRPTSPTTTSSALAPTAKTAM